MAGCGGCGGNDGVSHPAEALSRAMRGEAVLIEDWDQNEFRALVRLEAFSDHVLYVSREVDGEILNLLDETQETVVFYNQQESIYTYNK